ncbi:MAG: hypothetical protein U1G08_06805 [Verrucomicrobiota bacterium]
MKLNPYTLLRTGVALGILAMITAAANAAAVDFDADPTGNGSYGEINVTTDTQLEMPADGIFHCTKITVGPNATLSFVKNPLNTPVVLLAKGDVTIEGTIDVAGGPNGGAVAGVGGPGGFDGGNGGFGPGAPGNRGGDGQGPGRGIAANGANLGVYAAAAGGNPRTYGNVLINPLIGGSGSAGSGGNPGHGGGGGGGAILVASSTRIVLNGAINARGGYSPIGGGSGGAVRIVAPTGGGGGRIFADGVAGGGSGRIRVDCSDPNAFRNLTYLGSLTRGTRMYSLPPTPPKLSVVSVAGQSIPVNATEAVRFELPAGTSPNQSVVLRGTGFGANTAVQVAVIPEHSPSVVTDATLNGAANPPEVTVDVTLPVGESVVIQAWAK